MIRRVVRSLALSAALLTAGVAAVAVAPTAATAGPDGGMKKAADTLKPGEVKVYPVLLNGGENTRVRAAAKEDAELVLGVFDENQNLVEKKVIPAGGVGTINVTPPAGGKYYIAVSNPGSEPLSFGVIAD